VVRNQAYVKELMDLGAEYVLNSNDPNFKKLLKEYSEKLSAKICFNPIGGSMLSTLLTSMPNGSRIYVYGNINDEITGLKCSNLLFSETTISGIWLAPFLQKLTVEEKGKFAQEVHDNLTGSLKSKILKVFSCDQLEEAMKLAELKASEGKVLLRMGKIEKMDFECFSMSKH